LIGDRYQIFNAIRSKTSCENIRFSQVSKLEACVELFAETQYIAEKSIEFVLDKLRKEFPHGDVRLSQVCLSDAVCEEICQGHEVMKGLIKPTSNSREKYSRNLQSYNASNVNEESPMSPHHSCIDCSDKVDDKRETVDSKSSRSLHGQSDSASKSDCSESKNTISSSTRKRNFDDNESTSAKQRRRGRQKIDSSTAKMGSDKFTCRLHILCPLTIAKGKKHITIVKVESIQSYNIYLLFFNLFG